MAVICFIIQTSFSSGYPEPKLVERPNYWKNSWHESHAAESTESAESHATESHAALLMHQTVTIVNKL